MGWMNDTLGYFSKDPVFRAYHQNNLTFSMLYAFHENFILPMSHDEVVHGKGALLSKMPGDDWQKFANMRCFLSYMWAHPGKKLLFMGGEFGQWREWSSREPLDWALMDFPNHQGLARAVRDLNALYRGEPALHQLDNEWGGFEWIDLSDYQSSVISFLRKARDGSQVMCVFNFTPVLRRHYSLGSRHEGIWREVFNSDAMEYGGSGAGNAGFVSAQKSRNRHVAPVLSRSHCRRWARCSSRPNKRNSNDPHNTPHPGRSQRPWARNWSAAGWRSGLKSANAWSSSGPNRRLPSMRNAWGPGLSGNAWATVLGSWSVKPLACISWSRKSLHPSLPSPGCFQPLAGGAPGARCPRLATS